MKTTKIKTPEVGIFVVTAIITTAILFIGGIDSIVDAGILGFITGVCVFALIGTLVGMSCMILRYCAPELMQSVLNWFKTEPEEDYYNE